MDKSLIIEMLDEDLEGRLDITGLQLKIHCIPKKDANKSLGYNFMREEGFYFYEKDGDSTTYIGYADKIIHAIDQTKDASIYYIPEPLSKTGMEEFNEMFEEGKSTETGIECIRIIKMVRGIHSKGMLNIQGVPEIGGDELDLDIFEDEEEVQTADDIRFIEPIFEEEEEEVQTADDIRFIEPIFEEEEDKPIEESNHFEWFMDMGNDFEFGRWGDEPDYDEATEPEVMTFEPEITFGDNTVDDVLEHIKQVTMQEIANDSHRFYYLNSKGAMASGYAGEDGSFRLLKGSRITLTTLKSCPPDMVEMRRKAVEDGRVIKGIVQEDIYFRSLDDGALFVLGAQPGTLSNWQTQNGLTLRDKRDGMIVPLLQELSKDNPNIYSYNKTKMYFDTASHDFWLLNGSEVDDMPEHNISRYASEFRNMLSTVMDGNTMEQSLRFTTISKMTAFVTGSSEANMTIWKNNKGEALSE